MTRVRMMTPRYESNQESKISARSGGVGRPFRRRHQVHDGFQDLVHADALLGAGEHGIAGIQPDDGFDLLADALGFGGRKVDLVDDGNDFEVVVQRQVGVGERLRFDSLRRVHHQQRALARLQAARNFVREVHVAGRVDQVELVQVAVVGRIVQADGVGLDGDAALALEVHRVENLLHHFALRKRAGDFEQAVGQRRFAVVDMRNDREIADEFAVHASWGAFSHYPTVTGPAYCCPMARSSLSSDSLSRELTSCCAFCASKSCSWFDFSASAAE